MSYRKDKPEKYISDFPFAKMYETLTPGTELLEKIAYDLRRLADEIETAIKEKKV